MKINNKYRPNFKSIDYRKLRALDAIHLPNDKGIIEKMAEGIDVFLKSTVKSYPYHNSTLPVNSIKIIARPKNLTFFERLLGKKTVVGYFPTGNLRSIIEYNEAKFEDVFAKVVSQVK